jgi:CBS domain-containing protein
MFYIHGVAGRVFSGSLEQMKALAPLSPAARAQRANAREAADGEPSVASAGGGHAGHRAALAAYASTEQAAVARQPRTRVADVMSPRVVTLTVAMPVIDAWRVLAEHGHGQAPVVDAQGALVGLFVRADLMRADLLEDVVADASAWRALLAQPVHALMRTPVPATSPENDLRRVAGALLASGLPGLPVANEQGRVIGFVSRSDILRAVTADPPLDLWG